MFHLQSNIDQGLPPNPFRSMWRTLSSRVLISMGLTGVGLLSIAPEALAHHPLGGRSPVTLFEGFLSGIAHPVIGLDHLAFVIAVGLSAALMSRRGLWIPIGFVLAGLLGTAIHLQSLDLPAPEFFIAASVFLFGMLLAFKTRVNGLVVAGLATVAGVFHGYAYGEAIVGATMTPLVAYLIGFTMIQLIISLTACGIGRLTLARKQHMPEIPIRFAGFMIFGIGTVFLSSILMG